MMASEAGTVFSSGSPDGLHEAAKSAGSKADAPADGDDDGDQADDQGDRSQPGRCPCADDVGGRSDPDQTQIAQCRRDRVLQDRPEEAEIAGRRDGHGDVADQTGHPEGQRDMEAGEPSQPPLGEA